MFEELIGGGVFVVLAGVLWLVYLLPNWFKRSEYLATQRNTIRLQQTLKALSETAEVPQRLSVEISRDAVAEHEKQLRQSTRQAARAERAALQEEFRRQREQAAQRTPVMKQQRLARIRTVKMVAALLLTVAVGVGIFGIVQAATGALAALWLAAGSLAAAFGSLLLLAQLNRVSRMIHRRSAAAPRRATPIELPDLGEAPVAAPRRRQTEWQPIALPKPLYLDRDSESAKPASQRAPKPAAAAVSAIQARAAVPAVDAQAERLRRDSDASIQRLREAQQQTPSIQQAPSERRKDRFATMGVVDSGAVDAASPADLSEILRRRRSAG